MGASCETDVCCCNDDEIETEIITGEGSDTDLDTRQTPLKKKNLVNSDDEAYTPCSTQGTLNKFKQHGMKFDKATAKNSEGEHSFDFSDDDDQSFTSS